MYLTYWRWLMRIDVPTEDDTPQVPAESHLAEAPPSDEYEPLDGVAYAANYRSIVHETYQDYRATPSEIANLQTHRVHLSGAVDANSGSNCSPTVALAAELVGEWQRDEQSDFAWLMRSSGITWPRA
jgi:hypothetical protein